MVDATDLEGHGDRPGHCAGGCGGGPEADERLPDHVREKIRNHPCFSEDAHHHYARMHVAVAPACNIQCHYCNRKYDCSNESRPGVVSELLTPEQAVAKALAVGAAIPQMSVLGIAGPGDPLANPEQTFATFGQLSAHAPDLNLCVSTNGLALPEHVEALCRHNIDHVTITINCVDPEVGAKIHPWIFWNHRRIKGRKAAAILIAQQQKGLEMLVERGILVKVNSVMIPGVNDAHLEEVSRVVKRKGAFLHNVMPLIAEPEHGTFFGVMGQRGPTGDELRALQEACGGDMRMMRHCRQCRADAVGLLGEDRQGEFTTERVAGMTVDAAAALARRRQVHGTIEARRAAGGDQRFVELSPGPRGPASPRPVLMAVAAGGDGRISRHLAEVREFSVYEATAGAVRLVERRRIAPRNHIDETRGHAQARLEGIVDALAGCEVVLCSGIGLESWRRLEAAGLRPNGEHALEPAENAVAVVYEEMPQAGVLRKRGFPQARASP